MEDQVLAVDQHRFGIARHLLGNHVQKRPVGVLFVNRAIERHVAVQRNVLLPRRGFDRGDDLAGNAQLRERVEGRGSGRRDNRGSPYTGRSCPPERCPRDRRRSGNSCAPLPERSFYTCSADIPAPRPRPRSAQSRRSPRPASNRNRACSLSVLRFRQLHSRNISLSFSMTCLGIRSPIVAFAGCAGGRFAPCART